MRDLRVLLVAVACAAVLAPANALAAQRIETAVFTSATDGWIGGGFGGPGIPNTGFVSRTRDGGLTWTSTRIPSSWILDLDFSGQSLWGTSSFSGYLQSSTDAGATWAKAPKSVAPMAQLTKVVRLPSGRLVAAGLHSGTVNGKPHGVVALLGSSDDAGATWTRRYEGPLYMPSGDDDQPPPTQASIADVAKAPSGTTLWAVGNEWTRGGSRLTYKQRLLLKSTDSGATWTLLGGLPKHTSQRVMTSIVAPSADVIMAFGDSVPGTGRLQYLRSTDAGAKWSALEMPAITGAREVNARSAVAIDADRIIVAGDMKKTVTGAYTGIILWTTDGGATWRNKQFTDVPSLRDIVVLSANSWLAVGGNEVMLRTADAGLTWTGMTKPVAPVVTRATPTAGFSTLSGPVTATGTSADTGVGVAAVDVRLRRADGRYFNGVSWGSGEVWLPAQSTDSWRTWAFTWTPDAGIVSSRMAVTMSFAAVDGCGNRSAVRSVTSAGRTRATVGTPAGLPSTMIAKRAYRFTGVLKPQHTGYIRVYAYRWEKQKDGTSKWIRRRAVYAKAIPGQKYSGSISLPYKGRWLIRAYHPLDAAHIASWSGTRRVTVK
jgi:photosystem II stability/assembly factor-like uncharacterized protein